MAPHSFPLTSESDSIKTFATNILAALLCSKKIWADVCRRCTKHVYHSLKHLSLSNSEWRWKIELFALASRVKYISHKYKLRAGNCVCFRYVFAFFACVCFRYVCLLVYVVCVCSFCSLCVCLLVSVTCACLFTLCVCLLFLFVFFACFCLFPFSVMCLFVYVVCVYCFCCVVCFVCFLYACLFSLCVCFCNVFFSLFSLRLFSSCFLQYLVVYTWISDFVRFSSVKFMWQQQQRHQPCEGHFESIGLAGVLLADHICSVSDWLMMCKPGSINT